MTNKQPLKSSRVSTWSFTWPELYDLIAEHKIVNGRIACIGHCCTFVDYIKNSNSQPSEQTVAKVAVQHSVNTGELSSCVSANDVKNAPRNGTACDHVKNCPSCSKHYSLSQLPDQEVENLNIPLEKGAATESVAKCSSVYEDNDMIVNCELSNRHTGEHRVNGELGFHWKSSSEETAAENNDKN